MLASWMTYTLLVSALLALAALASEKALGLIGRPFRWVWIVGLLGGVAIPLVAFVAPTLFGRTPDLITAFLPDVQVGALPATSGPDPTGETGTSLGRVLAAVWIAASLLVTIYLGQAYRRLRSEMRDWRREKVLHASVMISDRRGPAVVGMLRPIIVVPTWLLAIEESLLRAVFQHEQEHLRAGDQRLFGLGVALCVLTPWNPFSWWQLDRLRLAIEFDCDRRVLASGVTRRVYVNALMAVGTRASGHWLPQPAFAGRRAPVERRLRRIIEPVTRLRMPRTISASGVAALAIILVLGAPPPNSTPAPADGLPEGTSAWAPPDRPAATNSARPMFIPYDRPPELENRERVVDAISAIYPTRLRERGVGGRVEMWLYIDEKGAVERFVTKTSSGNHDLDAAARAVVPTLSFKPAVNRDRPTAVWISQWFTFTPHEEQP